MQVKIAEFLVYKRLASEQCEVNTTCNPKRPIEPAEGAGVLVRNDFLCVIHTADFTRPFIMSGLNAREASTCG